MYKTPSYGRGDSKQARSSPIPLPQTLDCSTKSSISTSQDTILPPSSQNHGKLLSSETCLLVRRMPPSPACHNTRQKARNRKADPLQHCSITVLQSIC